MVVQTPGGFFLALALTLFILVLTRAGCVVLDHEYGDDHYTERVCMELSEEPDDYFKCVDTYKNRSR